MISIRKSTFIKYEENVNLMRMELEIDTASELPSVDHFEGHRLYQGSIAHDISTGEFYAMDSSGTWKKQNSGGGSGTVEYFEVNINQIYPGTGCSISSTYDEIKAAIDSGKIINGTFTLDLSAAGFENAESAVSGCFDERATLFDEGGCIALYSAPFTVLDEVVFIYAYLITSDDTIYLTVSTDWAQATEIQRGKNVNVNFSDTPLAKLINTKKNGEEKK